jgi:sulfate permease, SulP family
MSTMRRAAKTASPTRKACATCTVEMLEPQRPPFPFAVAMRRTIAHGYTRRMLQSDVMAGAVVAIVALPLSMALSIAVGAPPQHGLYTAIVAGFLVALSGGSKHQVTGPTAAFVVVLAPIVTRYGVSGLLTAGMMAGVLLALMGFMRLGKLIEFIPHPVTTGFTAGIATVIATLQLKDCFGLHISAMPDSYFGKIGALWAARRSASIAELGVAVVTLALLVGVPRITKRIPAPLVAITLVSIASALVAASVPSFHVATIGTRFSVHIGSVTYAGIPPLPPFPHLPWGAGGLSFGMVRDLGGAALAIAMLGAIESLLSAVIADATTGKRHDPDAELVALGLGNVVAPFFGGIAATGALARTATNIRAGAVSPIAAASHALFVLAAVLLGSRLVAYVPMASLAALLLLVAWNMSELDHFVHTVRVAPRSDVLVLVTCFVLTVVFDMVVAVSVGVVLAALLFMKRMSAMTESRLTTVLQSDETRVLARGIALYEIAGPLFFGAAQRAMRSFEVVEDGVKVVVLALGAVPVIDATGLVALEATISSLEKANKLVIIAGPLPEPRSVFERAHLDVSHEKVFFADDTADAIKLASDLILLTPELGKPSPGG